MPDADHPWTEAELDTWVQEHFDGELWKLDAAPSWDEYDPELEISSELRTLWHQMDREFSDAWGASRAGDQPAHPVVDRGPVVNPGTPSTPEQRWQRMSIEMKTRLRRSLEDAAAPPGPDPVPPAQEPETEESIVPDLLGQHTTGFVPGKDPDPVGDVLRRPVMRWAVMAFGFLAVTLFALWLFAQRFDDDITATDTEPSAGAVSADEEPGDGEASGDPGPPTHDCADGAPVTTTGGEVDAAVTPETVTAHRSRDDRIYIEICFTGPWTDAEALERQWSMFAGILVQLGDLGSYSGVEQHDGVRTTRGVLLPGESEFPASAWILPDGNVLVDTGRAAGDAVNGDVELDLASTTNEGETKRTATAAAQVDIAGAPEDADALIDGAEAFSDQDPPGGGTPGS